MERLIDAIVRSGFTMAWRFASWPTSRSPVLVNATTDGVVRLPSAFGMTVGTPPSITAITEFVVPRSMPTTGAAMERSLLIAADAVLYGRRLHRGRWANGERQDARTVVVVGDHVVAVVEFAGQNHARQRR